MKKLLLSLLFGVAAVISHAQTAKPTKQQTIDYLKSVLVNQGMTIYTDDSDELKLTAYYTITKVEFEGTVITVYYDMKGKCCGDPKLELTTNITSVDLSKIESVEKIKNGNKFILLNTINKQRIVNDMQKDITDGANKTKQTVSSIFSIPAQDQERIMKAFDYLRKLCGAPDPIKFD